MAQRLQQEIFRLKMEINREELLIVKTQQKLNEIEMAINNHQRDHLQGGVRLTDHRLSLAMVERQQVQRELTTYQQRLLQIQMQLNLMEGEQRR